MDICNKYYLFGKKGCLVKELSQYDKLMRIDDDSYFKSKIDFDFFDILDKIHLQPVIPGLIMTIEFKIQESFFGNFIKNILMILN